MSPTTTSTAITDGEQTELVIRGFRSFTDVNLVRKAISRLPGVSQVQARPLGQGAMRLLVSYAGMVPFEVHVTELLRSRGCALPAHVELAAA